MKRSMFNIAVIILISALTSACSCGSNSTSKKTPEITPESSAIIYTADINGKRALFITDGSAQGSVKLDTDLDLSPLMKLGSTYYYLKENNTNLELWKTEGTLATTERIVQLPESLKNHFIRDYAITGDTLYFSASDNLSRNNLWYFENGTITQLTDFDFDYGEYESIGFILARGNNVFFSNKDKLFLLDHETKTYTLIETLGDDYLIHLQDIDDTNNHAYLVAHSSANNSRRTFTVDSEGEINSLDNTPVTSNYSYLYNLNGQRLVIVGEDIRYLDTNELFTNLYVHDSYFDRSSNSLFFSTGETHYLINAANPEPLKLLDYNFAYFHQALAWSQHVFIEDPSKLIVANLDQEQALTIYDTSSSIVCHKLEQVLIGFDSKHLYFHHDDKLYTSQGLVLIDGEYQMDCQLLKDFSAVEPEA